MNEKEEKKLTDSFIHDIGHLQRTEKYYPLSYSRKFGAFIGWAMSMALLKRMPPDKMKEHFDYYHKEYEKKLKEMTHE